MSCFFKQEQTQLSKETLQFLRRYSSEKSSGDWEIKIEDRAIFI